MKTRGLDACREGRPFACEGGVERVRPSVEGGNTKTEAAGDLTLSPAPILTPLFPSPFNAHTAKRLARRGMTA
jgi:hypothetical protein